MTRIAPNNVRLGLRNADGTAQSSPQQLPARSLDEVPAPRAANLAANVGNAGNLGGNMRTGQAFQGAARNASLQSGPATANALAGGNFNPLAGSQLGGRAQPQGLLDDLLGAIGGGGLGGSGGLGGLDELGGLGGGGGYFEDRVAQMMFDVVEDMQKKIEQRLQKLQAEAQAAEATTAAGGKDTGGESRNIEFEKIKFDMQKLSQMQQAMSNILNTQDELAKSAIRQIKGG